MIDKDEARKAGYEVVDSATKLPDEKAQKVAQIKSILPALVNGDGAVDVSALKDLLGIENVAASNQGYSLNFAGKGLAKIKADQPTSQCLKMEEKQSKNFDATGNVVIRGDNLDVLKILRQNYTGKIKMIYIDPPYNTDSLNFIYPDSFKMSEAELIEQFDIDEEAIQFFDNMFGSRTHSGWLFAMYPRLKLARDLLTDDGVIFISIDDNEQANLKIMCDEIFGEENFVANYIWKGRSGKDHTAKYVSINHESILCYAKALESLQLSKDVRETKSGSYSDEHGTYSREHIRQWGGTGDRRADRPTMFYPVIAPDNSEIFPIKENGEEGRWRINRSRMQQMLDEKKVDFVYDEEKQRWDIYAKKYEGEKTETAYTTILDKFGTSADGTKELKSLFNEKVFDTAKSMNLIKHLVYLSNAKYDDIILDFFAGSGTTAHAVMQLNAEDGGNRKFILAQLDERINKKTSPEAHKFCTENKLKPVVSSITIERINRAGEKISSENGALCHQPDIGYKVFSLTDRPALEKTEDGKYQPKLSGGAAKEVLYNMMTASGEALLTDSIEEIEANLLYKVGNSYYVLGECAAALDQFSSHRIYIDGWANIRLERWLNLLGLDKENVKVLYY